MLQANEAIKLILGIGTSLAGRLLMFDALETEFREVKLWRDPQCPACGAAAHLDPAHIGEFHEASSPD